MIWDGREGEFTAVLFFGVVDTVILWRGRDVFVDQICTNNAYLSRDGSIFEGFLHLGQYVDHFCWLD